MLSITTKTPTEGMLEPRTALVLSGLVGSDVHSYYVQLIKHCSWGLITNLPVVFDHVVALPVGLSLTADYVVQDTPISFDTTVLGYLEFGALALSPPANLRVRDRREYSRLRVPVPISYITTAGPPYFSEQTFTYDISLAGMCIQTSRSLEPGIRINILLEIPEKQCTLYLSARVVWSGWRVRSHVAGVEFDQVSEQDQAFLAAFWFQLEHVAQSRTLQ